MSQKNQETTTSMQPKPPKTMEGQGTGEPGRVLLASVSNIMYPVDLDLIHHLFSRFGEVEKIVSFFKTPTLFQALIQFARPEQAQDALANLHNRNIYDGCNTLQLQESRLPELVVKSNCAKSWDYTQSAAGPGASGVSIMDQHPQQHVHPDIHQQAAARTMYSPYGGVRPVPQPPFCFPHERLPQELREMDFDFANPTQTPVIIVYNIPSSVTIQMLFNLFSLYGVVLRIKILKERPDTALVQYAMPFYATIAQCLMMGEDVEKYVKGACRPTKTVFVANVHEDASADDVAGLFKQFGQVLKFTFKTPKNESSKTKLCIMELENEERALSAVMHLHNYELMGRCLKVAFSKSVI